jgi:hypothetical protein
MKENLQQFLYELFFGRDIHNQFTYMHKKPYMDGFQRGVRFGFKQILLSISLLEESKAKYPKHVTDKFIIETIKSMCIR